MLAPLICYVISQLSSFHICVGLLLDCLFCSLDLFVYSYTNILCLNYYNFIISFNTQSDLPYHPVLLFKNNFRDFPGGAVVKNPPANAGDTGSSPGPGGSHMPRSNYANAQPLSLRSRAREPQLLSPHAYSPCSTAREATAMRSPRTATKSSPGSRQLEKARVQQ